jgi:hypothetical protein
MYLDSLNIVSKLHLVPNLVLGDALAQIKIQVTEIITSFSSRQDGIQQRVYAALPERVTPINQLICSSLKATFKLHLP